MTQLNNWSERWRGTNANEFARKKLQYKIPRGGSGGLLGSPGGLLGVSWGLLGFSWGSPGGIPGSPECILEVSWGSSGVPWGLLETRYEIYFVKLEKRIATQPSDDPSAI